MTERHEITALVENELFHALHELEYEAKTNNSNETNELIVAAIKSIKGAIQLLKKAADTLPDYD